jgi:hypothetical protein
VVSLEPTAGVPNQFTLSVKVSRNDSNAKSAANELRSNASLAFQPAVKMHH